MHSLTNRRGFIRTTAVAGAGLLLARPALGAKKKVLLFTKSSGFEHQVIKVVNGQPSIMETAIRGFSDASDFELTASKDGRIFDSKELNEYAAVVFFTTGDLTTEGTDKNPPMSADGKQKFLDSIHEGKFGFVGVHAASDTFHTPPDPQDLSNRYIAHGEQSDPYIRMIGGEFIIHGQSKDPRLQSANVIINDPAFPGLEGVKAPVSLEEEWYSMKDFAPNLHVICTLDTSTMNGNAYKRPPYPVVWDRMHGKGRVFYTAIGDRPENWQNAFHLNLLAGGIRWAMGAAKASVTPNLKTAAPGYATIPPKYPPVEK